MADRDDFSSKVRQAVALRAGYFCSFTECGQLTAGPSGESSMATAQVGIAAHICAAAPGGPRYDASMTPEERAHIDNAIWMCATHATLIDRDEVTYPVDALKKMKVAHEARIAAAVREKGRLVASLGADDLFALGPGLVCAGKIVGAKGGQLQLLFTHYVIGDLAAVISFGEVFAELPAQDRYLLMDSLGDGRLLAEPPRWQRTAEGLLVDLNMAPRTPRTRAQDLGSDLELGPNGDLKIINGDLAVISGEKVLPQMIQRCLLSPKGALLWDTEYGHRLAQYFVLYQNSPWFDRLVRLEVIRLAAVPYYDELRGSSNTHLQCVERVIAVEIIGPVSGDKSLPAQVEFEVAGVGRWKSKVSLYVGDPG